jgi:hypothetical protein
MRNARFLTSDERRAILDAMAREALQDGTYWGNPAEPCAGFRKECDQAGTHFYVDPAGGEVKNVCADCYDLRERYLEELSEATRKDGLVVRPRPMYPMDSASAAEIATMADGLPPEFSAYKETP